MNAQSSLGVVIVICAVIFVAIMLASKIYSDKSSEKRDQAALDDLLAMISHEVDLPARSEDGYSREFEVPKLLEGKEYNLQLYQDILTLSYKPNYLARTIILGAKVDGKICKGKNRIRKSSGKISVECKNNI